MDDSGIACLCPDGKDNSTCVYICFLRDYGDHRFPLDDRMSGAFIITWLSYVPAERLFLVVDDTQTFLFARSEHHADDTYINFFSVLSRSAHSTIKNRVVVENTGNDEGIGEWKCHKDSRTTECVHIVDARHALQRYLHGDPHAMDPNTRNGTPQSSAVSIPVILANIQ